MKYEDMPEISYVAEYYQTPGAKEMNHRFKDGDILAVIQMGKEMAQLVPKDVVLIPIPGRTGRAVETLKLAYEIASRTGCKVIDAIRGNERESQFEMKKSGNCLTNKDFGFRLICSLPDNANTLLIDNVIATASTFRAARKVICTKILVHSIDITATKI